MGFLLVILLTAVRSVVTGVTSDLRAGLQRYASAFDAEAAVGLRF